LGFARFPFLGLARFPDLLGDPRGGRTCFFVHTNDPFLREKPFEHFFRHVDDLGESCVFPRGQRPLILCTGMGVWLLIYNKKKSCHPRPYDTDQLVAHTAMPITIPTHIAMGGRERKENTKWSYPLTSNIPFGSCCATIHTSSIR
jgi:hypothetical protein